MIIKIFFKKKEGNQRRPAAPAAVWRWRGVGWEKKKQKTSASRGAATPPIVGVDGAPLRFLSIDRTLIGLNRATTRTNDSHFSIVCQRCNESIVIDCQWRSIPKRSTRSSCAFIETVTFFYFHIWRIWNEFHLVLFAFAEFYRVLPSFTNFYWVLLSSICFYRILPMFTRFYRVLLFYLVLSAFTEFYRVLLGFTEFYRVLLSFT